MSDQSRKMDLNVASLSDEQIKEIKKMLDQKVKATLKIDECEVIVE